MLRREDGVVTAFGLTHFSRLFSLFSAVIEQSEFEVIRLKTGIELTEQEIGHLQLKIPEIANQVRKQSLIASGYLSVVRQIRFAVKSSTKFRLKEEGCRYSFDGPIPGAYGQGNTVFQFAYQHATVYCAKIGLHSSLHKEKAIADRLSLSEYTPTLMSVVDFIRVGDAVTPDRYALITPYYPVCLSQVVGALDDDQLMNVALCTVSSIRAFSACGLCHGDIKPSNLMFANSGSLVVTIDFGSAGEFDTFPIGGSTPTYGLGAAWGTKQYDSICLSATLAELKWGSEILNNTHTLAKFQRTIRDKAESPTKEIIEKLLTEGIEVVWEFLQAQGPVIGRAVLPH